MTLATTFNETLAGNDSGQLTPYQTIDGKPGLELPGDGRLISDFAVDLADLISGHDIFSRKGSVFKLNDEAQKLELVTTEWLRTWVERHVVPFKVKSSNAGTIRLARTMTDDTARAVLASPQFIEKLPAIERFHPCPMPWLRSNETIELLPVGLDPESRTFTADIGFSIEPKTLRQSRNIINRLLGEFAWPNDGGRSKAVAISAMLTVFAGGIMPSSSPRPVFVYVANSEGSGKTLLARLAGIPYQETPVATAPRDEAEWQKTLLSLVVSGRRLLILDNVKGHLNSGALEAYTTSSHFSGRILGVTKEFTGEAGATVLITGNNLTVTPDLRRRSLFVELFLEELRPEDRQFQRILDSTSINSMRPDVLSALWGIVKAWDEAGRPSSTHNNSSFPRWCDTIAGIVEHAGYLSPTAPAEIEGMGDTDSADFSALVELMAAGTRYTFENIATMAIDEGLFERITSDTDNGELSRGARRRFSTILTRYTDRRVSASSRFSAEGKGHSKRFRLIEHAL